MSGNQTTITPLTTVFKYYLSNSRIMDDFSAAFFNQAYIQNCTHFPYHGCDWLGKSVDVLYTNDYG